MFLNYPSEIPCCLNKQNLLWRVLLFVVHEPKFTKGQPLQSSTNFSGVCAGLHPEQKATKAVERLRALPAAQQFWASLSTSIAQWSTRAGALTHSPAVTWGYLQQLGFPVGTYPGGWWREKPAMEKRQPAETVIGKAEETAAMAAECPTQEPRVEEMAPSEKVATPA